jgi:tripartite-type tricarboxylate transporter receptor subunit TctC
MPDVPTTAEAGYPDFQLKRGFALFAPTGTPRPVIARLTSAVQESLKTAEVVERARATGMAIRYMSRRKLDATVKTDLEYWSKVIRDAKITAD